VILTSVIFMVVGLVLTEPEGLPITLCLAGIWSMLLAIHQRLPRRGW
jgi:hypothetical protein